LRAEATPARAKHDPSPARRLRRTISAAAAAAAAETLTPTRRLPPTRGVTGCDVNTTTADRLDSIARRALLITNAPSINYSLLSPVGPSHQRRRHDLPIVGVCPPRSHYLSCGD